MKTDNKKFTEITAEDLLAYYEQSNKMPEARELEEGVLGGMMLDKDGFDNAVGITEDCFYQDRHKDIFRAIKELNNKRKPVDLITVFELMKIHGTLEDAGGPAYLAELTNRVASSANIEYHTLILRRYAVRRSIIKAGIQSIERGLDMAMDPMQVANQVESEIFRITSSFHTKSVQDAASIGRKMLVAMDDAKNRADDEYIGQETGFHELDELCNGLQPSDLIIIGARPGMGKTAFCLGMASNMSVGRKQPGLFFSLEMSAVQLGQRMVSADAEISVKVLRDSRKAEGNQMFKLTEAIERFSDSPIYIDDTPGISIQEIMSKARMMKAKFDIQYVIVDYLQLMSSNDGNFRRSRDEIVGDISRGLKAVAKELDIPVIALSQLNRGVESRGSKRPGLADLRESGNIEQDADMIGFLFRPEYYNVTEDENGRPLPPGLTLLDVAKNRHGELKEIPLRFIGEFTKFVNFREDDDFPSSDDEPPIAHEIPNIPDDELPF